LVMPGLFASFCSNNLNRCPLPRGGLANLVHAPSNMVTAPRPGSSWNRRSRR
jgi:hypothetical protein